MSGERSLTLAAVAVLAALGVVCLYGIFLYAWMSSGSGYFTYSPAYLSFSQRMDRFALPLAAAFLVVLALCIPRRVVRERYLMRLWGVILVVSLPLYLLDYRAAAVLTASFALVLQLLVVLMLPFRWEEMRFMFQSRRKKLGSALTHLGVPAVLLGALSFQVFPALFWAASVVMCAGILLLFYGGDDDTGWSG